MRAESMASRRLAGMLLAGSGLAFVVTVVYLFTVLLGLGLTFELFDDPVALVTWSQQHQGPYLGLWFLYLVVQLLFLPVPTLFGRAVAGPGDSSDTLTPDTLSPDSLTIRALTPMGTAAAVLGLAGVAAQVALTRTSFAWDLSTGSDIPALATMHVALADIGKDFRLLAELLLGLWMLGAGLASRRLCRPGWAWAAAGVGAWTVLVAGWKLPDPYIGLEDWLAFPIGVVYVGWGAALHHGTRQPSFAPVGAPS